MHIEVHILWAADRYTMDLMPTRREFLAGAAFAAVSRATPGPAPLRAREFARTEVRLDGGPCLEAQKANRRVLDRLPTDRLVHNFRVNAGLPSSAEPLGGWERPDCELRGHFTGHFLSACALMHASTGDAAMKQKADAIVAELARCQQALGDGYLSAFPLEYWDRLKARKKVWAPYYTLHKIMAGLLDAHQLCGNGQALRALEGVAGWVDRWTAAIPEAQMQDILNTEFGGMNEVLYNLAEVTGKEHYIEVGRRFNHARIFDPLAARRDELKGLHANTNVPKIIGAARLYELTGDPRFRDLAEFFWYEVTTARAYATAGTSNDEHWKTDPRRIAEELAMNAHTNECCVAYNLMKLTRHLYQWSAEPAYFDYYERALWNHRLGTIEPSSGATEYFLPLRAGAWKIFNTEYDSFWCCTGTGVEEYSKLNDSIYFQDGDGVFVNLFVPSTLDAAGKGIRLRQVTRFPDEARTSLIIDKAPARAMAIRVRVPAWATRGGSARLNGKPLDAFSSPASYLTISRVWKPGDRLEIELPFSLRAEATPDDPNLQAIYYGPLLLAAELGGTGLNKYQKDQRLKQPILDTPAVRAPSADPASWLEAAGRLSFRTKGQAPAMTLSPLFRIWDQRYAVYLRVTEG